MDSGVPVRWGGYPGIYRSKSPRGVPWLFWFPGISTAVVGKCEKMVKLFPKKYNILAYGLMSAESKGYNKSRH